MVVNRIVVDGCWIELMFMLLLEIFLCGSVDSFWTKRHEIAEGEGTSDYTRFFLLCTFIASRKLLATKFEVEKFDGKLNFNL